MKNAQYPITTILFDMDNTLFDLVGAQIASCNIVASSFGREDGEDLYEYFLRSVHGYEAHENILDYMKDRGISVDGLYTNARHIYEAEKLRNIIPYPGVIETLHRIQQLGFLMGIVTDAHSRDAILRMEKSGLLSYFSGMVTYDMVQAKKPSPEPFLAALEMLKADPCQTLLIGDSPRRDIEPCGHLGIRTVYARYGDRFTDDRSSVKADFIIDTMDELPGILFRLSEKQE
jgi:putative hydrolase of the HAD superfamily